MMTTEQFCYWLQGFFELTETDKLSEKQVLMIKEHLNLTFNKVTGPQPKTEYDDLNTKSYCQDFYYQDKSLC